MIASFLFWLGTIIALAPILNYPAGSLEKFRPTLFATDIIFGVFFWAAFILSLRRYLYNSFNRIIAFLLTSLFLFGSLAAGTGLAVRLLVPKNNAILPDFTLSPSGTVNQPLLTVTLKQGSSGTDVSLLQTLLFQDPQVYTGPASGYFGTVTRNGVLAFQKKHGLAQTGVTDPPTRDKLAQLYGSRPRSFWLGLIPTPSASGQAGNNPDLPAQWGKSVRVPGTEHGWTMRVGMDPSMATAQEIFDALNKYRADKGVHGLNWDGNLAAYAQERANYLNSIGSTDDHAGFRNYLENPDNVRKLGFSRLGENISYGFRLNGTHIIEWMYAGDAPHDSNQLDSGWSDVGIGVSGTATSVVFGGDRL